MTTRDEIRSWLREGIEKGATHVIVACDEFSHTNYPVFVLPGFDPKKEAGNLGKMQMALEVYALHLDLESQINEVWSFHYDMPPIGTVH